jgi:sugar lactone lactonase YvrE
MASDGCGCCAPEITTWYEAAAVVGKGGIWDPETQNYYYTDIQEMTLHKLHVPTKQRKDWKVCTQVGAMALMNGGEGLVLAYEDGFGMFTFKDEKFTVLANPYGVNTGWRMNDGACDSKGRFWAGRLFKTDESKPGEIYRLDTDGKTATKVIDNICCTNGLLWSPDNKLLYCGDSTLKKIFVWDYNEECGTVCNRRLFLDTAPLFEGVPDGATIDNEGYLWVCFFDGQKMVRISPQGKVCTTIDMPVKRPTQPSWFGPCLDELLVTSASLGVNKCEWPASGHIFHLRPGAQGRLKAKYNYNPVNNCCQQSCNSC